LEDPRINPSTLKRINFNLMKINFSFQFNPISFAQRVKIRMRKCKRHVGRFRSKRREFSLAMWASDVITLPGDYSPGSAILSPSCARKSERICRSFVSDAPLNDDPRSTSRGTISSNRDLDQRHEPRVCPLCMCVSLIVNVLYDKEIIEPCHSLSR